MLGSHRAMRSSRSDNQAERGEVTANVGAEALQPGHREQLAWAEPERARRVRHGVEQSEGDETTHQVGMQTGRAREGLEVETTRSGEGVVVIGASSDRTSTSWPAPRNSRRSSSLSEGGTMMRTSA